MFANRITVRTEPSPAISWVALVGFPQSGAAQMALFQQAYQMAIQNARAVAICRPRPNLFSNWN